jgi:allophanate hydrolase subunit 1/biotin carboxyl carrier protein
LNKGDTIRFKQVNYDYAVKSLKNEASLLKNLKEVYDLEIPELGTTYIDPIIEKYQKNHLNFIFRLSGDSHLLFELKMEKFEMENRFYMQFVVNDLKKNKINGLLEIVPGVSSLLIKYDPFIILANEISKKIIDIISLSTNESIENMVIPCRNVKLPISFRDRWTIGAIEKYMKTISNKAPYLPDNCEFVRKINEISSLEDLAKLISETKYIIFGLGDVYLGAPCAIPFDPRHRIITTKYNPARTFTPEGAVGIGGIYMCIYGMDSPGGYQLVGKTINIWNTYNDPPWLLDFFDIVRFYLVSDEDLIRIREDYKLGKYEPMIEPTTISLFEYKSFIESNKDSIREYEKNHDIKEISNRIDWSMIEHFDTNNENSIQDSKEDIDLKDCYLMKSSHYGNLYEMKVEESEKVKKGQTLALIEIMKTYHELKCPIDATVFKLFAKPGKIVKQGQLIAALKIE